MITVDSPFSKVVAHLPDYRLRVEIWAILGCVILFVSLIELVRRQRLKERYSFLWFLTAWVLLILTLRRKWLEDFSGLVGVYYPPTALLLLLVFFMILILIHFSTVISTLLRDKQILAQQIGILESRLQDLEKVDPSSPSSADISNSEDEKP